MIPRGLYAVLDDSLLDSNGLVHAIDALEAFPGMVQVRLKRLSDRQAIELLREMRRRRPVGSGPLVVNDRVDWALVSGADGVHVGEDDLPADAARAVLGSSRIVGVTVRTGQDIDRAAAAGATYVGLGPVFGTKTKQVNAEVLGLERFAVVAQKSTLPVVAIAGITLENIGEVAKRGAHAAAVVSDLLRGGDLRTRANALHQAFLRDNEAAALR